MTMDEFIDKLAAFTKEQKLKWEINNRDQLRCGHCCPITCFSGREADKVFEEAERLGIHDNEYFDDIISAADGRPSVTRRRLFQACGLNGGAIMTLEEFIVKLANFTDERNLLWRVDEDGAIRCGHYSCPITCFTMRLASLAFDESERLGLDDADMLSIVSAADKAPCHNKRVREHLLAACRLKETCRHD